MVELNSIVPDFSLMGSDEKEHKLSDYKGKKVVLYFYPRDNTPGCSTEACDFRDNHSNFIDNNVVILGVSRDSLKSHNKFIEKLNLPFVLLSDEKEEVCNLFNVIKEKNMYGKIVMGIERSTFIIDENGVLVKEYRKVKVKEHINTILNDLNIL